MVTENVINISKRLHSIEKDVNVLAGADEIYDDEKGKKQHVLNSEFSETLVNLQEQITEETSNREQAEAALETELKEYTDVEQTRAEAAEQNLQEAYAALTRTNIEVVANLPSQGVPNKIYRLVGATTFSDYQFNESDLSIPILLATYDVSMLEAQIGYYVCSTAAATAAKTIAAAGFVRISGGNLKVKFTNKNTAANATLNINSTGALPLFYAGERASSTNSWDEGEVVEIYSNGTNYYANNVAGGSGDGVFDISVFNAVEGTPATYADLAAALGSNGANVPANKRKGGMSVKFINSTSGKYKQCRLMAASWSTTVTDWQDVDDTPTAGSQNLVTSGGVEDKLAPLSAEINGGILLSPYYNGYLSNNWISNNDYRFYILQITPGESLTIIANSANKSYFILLESFSGFNPGTLAPAHLDFSYAANSTNILQVGNNYNYLLIYTKFKVGGSSIDTTPYSIKRGNAEIFNAIGINEEISNIETELNAKASKLLSGDGNLAMIDEFGAYKDSEINAVKCKEAINTIGGSERKETNILDALQLASGYYYTSSSITPAGSGSTNKYSTANVDISQYDSIDITAQSYSSAGSDTRACLIVDENNNILEAQTWGGVVPTPMHKVLHFDLKSLPGAKYILVSYSSNNCPNGIDVKAITNAKSSFEERLQAVESHFIHISIDDVNTPFAWLASNYLLVNSIFSESLFGLLRQLHNEYGAVFTLNCFMEGLSALATAGNKFASEFVNNSDWLKFAFHAYAGGVSYDQSKTSHTYRDADSDYSDFVNAVVSITGSVRNIDQVSRLGYFEGGESDLLEFRNAKMGIYGFLCSDSESRNSYYLDTDISKLVFANGFWYDAKNQLFFVSTNVPRLDVSEDLTNESAQSFVSENIGNGKKYIEAFMHETSLYSNSSINTLYSNRGNLVLTALCEYAKQNSYFHKFTQKYLFIM